MKPFRFRNRRGTSAEWALTNPILADGELGFEKDTKNFKFGDGATPWLELDSPLDAAGYLPINGKAANAELLDGFNSSAVADPNTVPVRTSAGRLVVADGSAVNETATVGQLTNQLNAFRREQI